MIALLKEIPELSSLFKQMKGRATHLPVFLHKNAFHIDQAVLDHYHMTKERFIQHAIGKWQLPVDLKNIVEEDKLIKFRLQDTIDLQKDAHLPFRYDYQLGTSALSLQKEELTQQLPDILILYLLLYNLSMIARYEIDWWTELFKEMGHQDLPFIKGLMEIAEIKIPLLIGQWLIKKEL